MKKELAPNLNGLRVLNTRPKAQALSLNQAIEAAGGQAISCPTLAICRLEPKYWLPQMIPVTEIDYAIFTSHNAVHSFFDGLQQTNIHWPATIQIVAIGQATANALKEYHCRIHHLPTQSDSEHLLALACLQPPEIQKKKIALIKGKGGRTLMTETLQTRGALLECVEVYQRTLPPLKATQDSLNQLWQNDGIDIIVLTSQQSMQQLLHCADEQVRTWLQGKPCLVISPRLVKIAQALGFKQILQSPMNLIIETLQQFQGRLFDEPNKQQNHS